MTNRSKQILRVAILAASVAALTGCNTIRNATGLGKEPPDEFAVVTKAPLVMPPDYNLRPPREGAPPLNQADPTDTAQAALFDSGDAAKPAAAGDMSEAEKQLLITANATNPDPSIRQLVATDGRAMEAANDSFTQKVLFWQGKDEGAAVDADAEAKRLDAQKNGGQTTPAVTPAKKSKDAATIGEKDEKKDSKGGWFDWF